MLTWILQVYLKRGLGVYSFTTSPMGKLALFHLLCGILIFWAVSVVKAEDPYKYFTWTATYGMASPLGTPQQVSIMFPC